MKKLITIIFTLFFFGAFGETVPLPPQVLTGPSTVYVGQTTHYTFTTNTIYLGHYWVVTNDLGFTDILGKEDNIYWTDVEWYYEGTCIVQLVSSSGSVVASLTVTVQTCAQPAVPAVTFSAASSTCSPRTISYSGTPPAGITWYWQTTSLGTTMGNSTNAFQVISSGTYYLRGWNGSCWSTSSASYAVTVDQPPATAGSPSVTFNTCGPQTLTRGTPPAGTGWYWQSTANGEDYTSATATASTYQAALNGTYYVYLRSRSSTGCWGTSVASEVTVNNPAAPTPISFQYCETTAPVWLSVDESDAPGWTAKWYDSETGSHRSCPDGVSCSVSGLSVGTYTYYVSLVSPEGCEGPRSPFVLTVISGGACDINVNWSENIGYVVDANGNSVPVTASKVYTDGFDAPVQSQVKSYATNQVFATQNIYDSEGNQTLSTLPAPINANTFGYRDRFVTNSSGVKYSASDFDLRTTSGTAGEITNPKAVTSNGIGSLGWYYSSTNTWEPNTPTTSFPYSRSYSASGPNPTSSKSAGPGDAYRMGANHETLGERLKFTKLELSHYYQLKHHFVTLKEVNNSTQGNWPIDGSISVVPGGTYTLKVKGYSSSSLASLYVGSKSLNADIYWGTTLPEVEDYVQVTFTVPMECADVYVGARWNPGVVQGPPIYITETSFYQENIAINTNMHNTSIGGYKIISTDPDGKKSATFTDEDGRTLATALVTSTSPYTYSNWSYTYYNDMGQAVATVAPNGVNTASTEFPTFVTFYKYDHLGRMIETTATDEGTSKFTYSNDGKIRFSQNQEQRNSTPQRFSYTNYDYLGRLIESGEYTMSGTGYYVFETHDAVTPAANSVLGIVDNTGYTGLTRRKNNATATRYSDSTFIDYDFPSIDFITDVDHTVQQNLMGQVVSTKNGNAITWYSYDEFGQLAWSKQAIFGLNIKTVDYTYDNAGNVTEVAYQKNQPADGFYHHYYYDADQRLTEVRANKQGETPALQAKYFYYLHGPLKRVELASNKQGIDYVYTISGGLKGINHADPAKDPGLDGISGTNAAFDKDIFGMNLHYYDGDYAGAGYSGGSLSVDGAYPNQFGGNIKAASYNSPADLNKKHVYAFQYDAVNQMSNAQWGSVTGSAGSYAATLGAAHQEQIPGYDKNGNIQSLVRKGKDAQTTANYNYVYEANTNKLDKVNHNSATLTDYTYNAIGQMVTQTEGGNVMNVKYNAYGLVKEIRNGSNQLIEEYKYDDRGDLVLKVYYTNGVAAKNAFYVSDVGGSTMAIYVQSLPSGSAQLVEVPIYGSGRVASYKPVVNTYFYEVTDHLGNVRGVIGVPETETYKATMESENVGTEEPPFKNVTNSRAVYVNANHTPSGNESARLNNAKPAGPAISFEVSPGDIVNMDVWAYYEAGSSNFSAVLGEASMINAIAQAFGGVSGAVGEAGQIFNNVNSGFAGRLGSSSNSTVPAAFLTYVVYDKNYVQKYFGSRAVTENGNMVKEHLVQEPLTIDEPGYIYICVYNRSDNANPVYFDDLQVSVAHSPIVAGADYYPFGLVMDGREITDEFYRYGYQGQYSERDTVTGWNEFELRMYDARFGRWLNVDPYGQYSSPYLAMGNNPALSTDPDGGLCCGIAMAAAGVVEGAMSVLKEMPKILGEVVVVGQKYSKLLGPAITNISTIGKVVSGGIAIEGVNDPGYKASPHPIGTNYKWVEDPSQMERSLEIRPINRNISTDAFTPSTPNPWINVAASSNDIIDFSTSIALLQASKRLNYWTAGARLGGEIFGHAFGAFGLGIEAWSIHNEWKTGNIGAHTYISAAVQITTYGIGIGAGIAGAPEFVIGAAAVGLGYGIYSIGRDKQIDAWWNNNIVPLHRELTMKIHRLRY